MVIETTHTEVSLELADDKFKFSPTGMTVQGQPTYKEWEQCGQQLKYIEKAVRWWIGDWLNYGEQRWGQMYSQAIDATDYAQGTLQNMKYVAGQIESSRRNQLLRLPVIFPKEKYLLKGISLKKLIRNNGRNGRRN